MNDPIKHDQRVKRWLLVIAIIAAFLAITTVLALGWGLNESQKSLETGQELATTVDAACSDPDVREVLGEACPKAKQVKDEDPQQIPLPGLPGRNGRDGTDGVDGQDGSRGPRGLRGLRGLPGDPGSDGAPGKVGQDGSDGSDGLNGLDGRGIRSMRMTDGGDLIVEFTDGTSQNFGPFIGPRGPEGPAGPQGEPGTPGRDGLDGLPGPACPGGWVQAEVEVVTGGIPPGTQKILVCIPQQAA